MNETIHPVHGLQYNHTDNDLNKSKAVDSMNLLLLGYGNIDSFR
jgi:hypothetical protein